MQPFENDFGPAKPIAAQTGHKQLAKSVPIREKHQQRACANMLVHAFVSLQCNVEALRKTNLRRAPVSNNGCES
jgi:hypothetical protein